MEGGQSMESNEQECTPEVLGKRLKDLRKNRNIKQDELAELFNVSVDSISNYERGKTMLPHWCIMEVCKKFHVSADYFYFGEEEKEKTIDDELVQLLRDRSAPEKNKIKKMIMVMFEDERIAI